MAGRRCWAAKSTIRLRCWMVKGSTSASSASVGSLAIIAKAESKEVKSWTPTDLIPTLNLVAASCASYSAAPCRRGTQGDYEFSPSDVDCHMALRDLDVLG